MQSDDLGLVERLASAGIVPAGWFLPWNEYHGYQQVAEQHNAEPDLVPLFGLDALIYLDGETQALLSGERAVVPHTKRHAEALYTVAVSCLKSYGVDVEAELAAKDAAIERLVAENRALLNDNPLASYDGARFVGADNEVLVAATPDVIRCPRPANGRPDSESVETCNASDNCGCCYRDRARQALRDAP